MGSFVSNLLVKLLFAALFALVSYELNNRQEDESEATAPAGLS